MQTLRPLAAVVALSMLAACEAPADDPFDASVRDGATRAVDAGPDAGPPDDLDGFIEWEMRAGGIPGAAVSIIEGDAIAFTGTYGDADVEAMREVDEHTLFIMASVSKTIAVTRAMQLVERGRLDLDAPLETYLGYPVRHPSFPDVPITTRMLLTHTSGLEDVFLTLARVTTSGSDPTETLAAFAEGYVTPGGAYYDSSNWGAEPGTRYSYCNAGFGVVGAVIQAAGGDDFRAQTESGIFQPLAMDGAGWFLRDVDLSRIAVPYAYNGRRFLDLPQHGFAFYPAASLRVSILGLSRFLIAIANGGELDGERVLTQESVDEILRYQIPDVDGRQALTFRDRDVNGHLYVGHSGETFGASTQMLLSRDRTHGIILITNSDAYVRSTLGRPAGADAMEAILSRLDEEALRL
jgi:CubicO group peptidase (beta-lactamase class C family)